ncbi:SYP72 [Linum grandiflorum]
MSVIDIIFRVDEICKKYDKYDIEKQRELNAYGDDAFARLYATVEAEIEAAMGKADRASKESKRAVTVALNAEIRKTKTRLMDEVTKLQKLALKKVSPIIHICFHLPSTCFVICFYVKGLSKEEQAIRADLVLALPERIQAIPDGTTGAANQSGGWTGSASHKNITFDTSEENLNDAFFQQSEESDQFRQEYDRRKLKQACKDEGLDVISEGLDTLKNLAHDMGEEMDRQVPLMDEIDTKVDKANSELRNTNVKLKQTLTSMRSSRNFCIDIILLCVILGIASYIYNLLQN